MSDSMIPSLTPIAPLQTGEIVIASFTGDAKTYRRDMFQQAIVAMVLGMVALWALGNPHLWTGAVGGLAAIALRGFYLSSDELKIRWDLTNRRLLGPGNKIADLADITVARPFMSAVQVVTSKGDKHLIKYQADQHGVIDQIEQARDAL